MQNKGKARAITDLYLAILRQKEDLVRQISGEHPDLLYHTEPRWGIPLHQARSTCQVGMLRLLVQRMCPDELPNLILEDNDDTALHLTLKKGHTEAACYLIEMAPMAAFRVNKKGVSPLYLAVEKGYEDLVSYFFQVLPLLPAGKNLLMSKSASLVHAAIKSRNLGILRVTIEKLPELVNISDYKGWIPLSYASYKGCLDGVHYFLKNFPYSVNMYDTDGSLPIHKAVGGGHVSVVKEFVLHCPQMLCDVDRNGRSVLHSAVKCSKADALSYLTKEGGIERIFDLKDRQGKTFVDL